jgi:two-component system nitrogen regulation sensor histidine kinase NtrY
LGGLETPSTRRADADPGTDAGLDDGRLPLPDANPLAFWVGLVVVLLSVVSGLATYLILTGLTPVIPRNDVVITVLFINTVLIIAMIGVIAWQMAGLWRAWRNKVAGARLHVRIVGLFSVIAALPAVLLAIAATTTFSRSLDGWFSDRTREIVANSLDVANAYLEEHGQVIRTDIVNMAKDLDDAAASLKDDPKQLRNLVMAQAGLRDLPAAYVIDASGKPIITAIEDDRLPYIEPPPSVIRQAEAGHVPLLLPQTSYRVAAVAKLTQYPGAYLYVVRRVSPKVMGHLRRTQAGVAEYEELRQRRGGLKIAHALMYFMISLTALLAAIWLGLWFAGRFVAPIRRLITAAQHVSKGHLNVQLPLRRGEGDLRRLSQTFNTMTSGLKTQRDALVAANEQLLERRRFMEAVLSGVSAGVLGLDSHGHITLVNRSGEKLLRAGEADLVGKRLSEALPQFAALIHGPEDQSLKGRPQHQVTLVIAGEERTFAVRVTHERSEGASQGTVVTFDDITELVSAQRTSAWADVARRIAHEIKNPLTPIQLSAERIRRKYGGVIKEDREVFDRCTETIIRQVGDVARMVDEFSSFARMPKPQMEALDLREAVRDPLTLFQMGTSDIDFELKIPQQPILMSVDRRLISQAVTNLVKNAAEAIQQAAESADKDPGYRGRIETCVMATTERATIEVVDNGIGLAKHNRSRLLEPYVTTKAKGTGLGLAIVQKIVEQHDGVLTLEDAPRAPGRSRGTLVRIALPMRSGETTAGPQENSVAAE